MSYDDELKHFGILGMRWGRRKQGSASSKSNRKPLTTKEKNRVARLKAKGLSNSEIKKRIEKSRSKKMEEIKVERVKRVARAVARVISTYMILKTISDFTNPPRGVSSSTYARDYANWLKNAN